MANRFVRASKYRHVFGKGTRKDLCYDNLRISRNAWDTNLVRANPGYIAVNWESSGGGTFAVIPVNERGKLPDQIPLFRGHTATVLDTDWNPFNDHVIASASDDGKVFIWQVPKDFTLYVEGDEIPDVTPSSKLTGHTRKVGHVLFNPAAENILASTSADLSVKLWDIGTGQSPLAIKHPDIVQSLSWSANGAMLVTTSRDKKLRVWDVRQEKPVHEFPGHEGAKNSRAVWMGEHNRIATTGFSRMSDRQFALWEPGRKDPIGGFNRLDSISGVCMPFWDDGSNCLYLAGKGDGNIRYYEYENDKFEYLSEYKSADPQRGMAFVPRRGVNVHENEVMRAYKTVSDSYIEPVSFTVPRRAETFQADIFPPATGIKPAMSAKEWLDGKTAVPVKIDLESVYDGTAPVEVPAEYKPPASAPAPNQAASKPAPKSEPERPAAARAPPPSVADQKTSMSAMASRYQDKPEQPDEDDETSSFEEIPKPGPRSAFASAAETTKRPPSPTKISLSASTPTSATPTTAEQAARPTPAVTDMPTATSATSAVESSLHEIKTMLEQQTLVIGEQSEKLSALTNEVEMLKKRVGSGAHQQDQSERIRQLELELEAARS